tara:strand:+ start:708 stop:1406 length:699 start_codon:yes stop_codon:yes gene_type:complete
MNKKIVAISTARAGSKSVKNKNLLTVKGKSLFLHPIEKASKSRYISKIFCTTNDPEILKLKNQKVFELIQRPEHLCTDKSSHHDVIKHAILYIEKLENTEIDYVVILLGNSLGASGKEIDEAIDLLGENDSVVSVNEMNMFNPLRAWKIVDETCETFINDKSIEGPNDKNALGNVYFFNGNFWVIKKDAVFSKDGSSPFPWLGQKIKPYIQAKVDMEVDALWQAEFIQNRRS